MFSTRVIRAYGYPFERKFSTQNSAAEASAENDVSLLHGVRVLDLTRVLAGPMCTQSLGDMGAEIIKIEKPGSGDETRNWGPPFVGGESCYFLAVNRNKKSVAVDISQPEGATIVQKIAAQCDVFIENFLPGKLKSYGLGYEDLSVLNPGLVYCSVTGYGPSGPYKTRGGYDVIASAIGGMMHITGPENGEPCKIGTAMTDISTGLYAQGAILAALFRRHRTGRGTKIDCNLLSTQVANLVNLGSNFLNAGTVPRRWGTAHESIVPYQGFQTKDGQNLIVGAGSDEQFISLCRRMAVDYYENEKFASNKARVANRVELIKLLASRFAEETLEEWLARFATAKFPFGPVNTFAQVFADPQVRHNDMVSEVDHKKAGRVRLLNNPVTFKDCNLAPRLPPPLLGEHTDAVLREYLKFDDHSLSDLRSSGVIS
ncbi:Succinate--hydroxymethylglutarate CoA-transferase [Hypsibius exemplaris]|uniref:Succinate--hydroxymethylglutarate CoA-transferase n=1 Tax=Hypsibius exemplaris TaxID=2072580 RepID=A0A1W0WLV7_HYPEX|nr:Succinate--hydroxymethylglutarate CoA-transferase [Hypsibius exemplaris]